MKNCYKLSHQSFFSDVKKLKHLPKYGPPVSRESFKMPRKKMPSLEFTLN